MYLRLLLSFYFVVLDNSRGLVGRYFMVTSQSAAPGIICAGQWIERWVSRHIWAESIIQEVC